MPARPSAVELTDGEAVPVVAHEETGEPVVVAEAHLHPMGMAVLTLGRNRITRITVFAMPELVRRSGR